MVLVVQANRPWIRKIEGARENSAVLCDVNRGEIDESYSDHTDHTGENL